MVFTVTLIVIMQKAKYWTNSATSYIIYICINRHNPTMTIQNKPILEYNDLFIILWIMHSTETFFFCIFNIFQAILYIILYIYTRNIPMMACMLQFRKLKFNTTPVRNTITWTISIVNICFYFECTLKTREALVCSNINIW